MLEIICQSTIDEKEGILVLPFWELPEEAADLSLWKKIWSKPVEAKDFKGKKGECTLLYDSRRIILLGLGKKEDITAESLRRAYSEAVRLAISKKGKTLYVIFPKISALGEEKTLQAVLDGLLLSNYAFLQLKADSLKENPIVLLEKAVLVGIQPKAHILEKAITIASSVYFVRELVNGNADDVTPKMVAQTAESLANSDLKVNVLDKAKIEKEKMGLLLAVNRGSPHDPYLVRVSYRGNSRSKEHIVLIGKGITYDSGGLALKSPENMLSMKTDMAGAAIVLGAIRAAAALKLKLNVSAIIPLTENSIDGKSYKNGDVYRSMSGKTVEINNTDAEGRLILADAMSYAVKYLNPTAMIDIATLTGAIVIALGEDIAGLFSNNEKLSDTLLKASQATGEKIWKMPLHSDYLEMLKSEIADLQNCAGRPASSITAALFLQEFCQSIPWAHLDIAGGSFLSKPKYYSPTRATGFGVRLLVDFLERCSVEQGFS